MAAVLLVATFLVGALAGVVVDRFALFREHRLLPRHGGRFVAERVLHHLDRELDLTPQQHTAIQKILEKRQRAIETAWRGIQPQVRQEMTRGNTEIEATLSPAQKAKFQRLRARWEEHARRMGR